MSFEKSPAPEAQPRPQKSQADIDAFFAKIDVLRAENEAQGLALIRTWMTPETRTKYDALQKRTPADLEAEDLRLFKPQPSHLGVGAEVPADFLASESQNGDKRLRQRLLPSRELKASKRRSEEEREESRKRAKGESSEEEEGRSALGNKKRKGEKKTEREPSAVNPLITNGILQIGQQGKEANPDIAVADIAEGSDEQQGYGSGALEHGEAERKKKKKRKKSKHQHSAEEGIVEGVEKNDPEELKSAAIEAEKVVHTVASPSILITAQNGDSEISMKSKDERKAEKKARKEERRKLKALA